MPLETSSAAAEHSPILGPSLWNYRAHCAFHQCQDGIEQVSKSVLTRGSV